MDSKDSTPEVRLARTWQNQLHFTLEGYPKPSSQNRVQAPDLLPRLLLTKRILGVNLPHLRTE